jgi:restriction system protein
MINRTSTHRENERAWESFRSELDRIQKTLTTLSYSPYRPFSNDTYNIGKHYLEGESHFWNALFLLPTDFVTHSLGSLIKPFPQPELPKIPELPPLKPKSVPDFYKTREFRDYRFQRDENWSRIAREYLTEENFEKQLISWEESHLIDNLLLKERSIILQIALDEKKREIDKAYDSACMLLKSLFKDIEANPTADSICKLIQAVHERHFLPEPLRNEFKVFLNDDEKILLIQFLFPDFSRRLLSCGELKNRNLKVLNQSAKKRLVKQCLYSLVIRAGYLSSVIHSNNAFDSVVINVEQDWFDPATGQPRNGIIASLHASVEQFRSLDLAKLDAEACFKSLKGLSTPSLDSVSPIRPIFTMSKEDERFVAGKNIEDSLVPESNLAAMEWEEFEHLVAQLFEWEFAKTGVEVRVTRASRDPLASQCAFTPPVSKFGNSRLLKSW